MRFFRSIIPRAWPRLTILLLVLGSASIACADITIYDSSDFDGAIVNTVLPFTPLADMVYTLSFNDSNPVNAHGNHVIGFSSGTAINPDKTAQDASFVDAFFFAMRNDGVAASDDTNVRRYYNSAGHGSFYTATTAGGGNGYMGPAGTVSEYQIVLVTTTATWTVQMTMGSGLGSVIGDVVNLGVSPAIRSIQIWSRDPGTVIGDGDVSNFSLTLPDPPAEAKPTGLMLMVR
jgi:hypothetical protein